MPTTIDLTKPIRQKNGNPAHYIGLNKYGQHVVEALLSSGIWSPPLPSNLPWIEQHFENVPVERPKLEGFLEVYSSNHSWDCCIEVVHEEKPDQEAGDIDGSDYWLTIDLSKVPADAIVKVAP